MTPRCDSEKSDSKSLVSEEKYAIKSYPISFENTSTAG